MQSLRTLNLADNVLEELVPRLFQQLAKLKYLDLSGNTLEDLTPDVFRDIMVRKMDNLKLAHHNRKSSFNLRIWKH